MKTVSPGERIERNLDVRGAPQHERFEQELSVNLMGDMIRASRKERGLTQVELGKRIGVSGAQVSRLENAAHAVTVSTLIRVFDALDATLLFRVELDGKARALTLPFKYEHGANKAPPLKATLRLVYGGENNQQRSNVQCLGWRSIQDVDWV